MKIVTLLGSPRLNGNTSKALTNVEALLQNEHDVERINLALYAIHGCLGCSKCQVELEQPGCVQKDDVEGLLYKLIEADIIIYGTPLYGHCYSSLLKTFLDRHIALFKMISGGEKSYPEMKSLIEEKKVALLVTCQGPEYDNTELIKELFNKYCITARVRNVGSYVVPFCISPTDTFNSSKDIATSLVKDLYQTI